MDSPPLRLPPQPRPSITTTTSPLAFLSPRPSSSLSPRLCPLPLTSLTSHPLASPRSCSLLPARHQLPAAFLKHRHQPTSLLAKSSTFKIAFRHRTPLPGHSVVVVSSTPSFPSSFLSFFPFSFQSLPLLAFCGLCLEERGSHPSGQVGDPDGTNLRFKSANASWSPIGLSPQGDSGTDLHT